MPGPPSMYATRTAVIPMPNAVRWCAHWEAQAQAICMATNDFHRAYHAFVAKQKPVFEGD